MTDEPLFLGVVQSANFVVRLEHNGTYRLRTHHRFEYDGGDRWRECEYSALSIDELLQVIESTMLSAADAT